MWLAGGGIKPGITLGETDEFGFAPVEDRVHVHDLQATILHLLGLDHTKLTFRFQGRDFRLTDVHGEVVKKLLALRPAADDPRPAHDAGQMPISKSRKLSSPARSPRLPSKSRMPSKFRPHRMLRSCPSRSAGGVGVNVEDHLVQVDLQPEQVEVQRAEDQVQDVALLQDCVDVTAGRGHLFLGDPRRFQIDRQRDLPIDLAILLSFPVDRAGQPPDGD